MTTSRSPKTHKDMGTQRKEETREITIYIYMYTRSLVYRDAHGVFLMSTDASHTSIRKPTDTSYEFVFLHAHIYIYIHTHTHVYVLNSACPAGRWYD